MNRRAFLQAAAGGLVSGGDAPLLRSLPGPPLLSACVLARRGDGSVALRRTDGSILGGGDIGLASTFRVASISKMITAAGFMRLVASHAIDLDGDASQWLGARLRHPAFADTVITPRMLLSHTGGIRNGADFPVPFGADLMARLSDAAREPGYGGWFAPQSEPPGQWFAYSDVNFGLVAQMIETVTGQRFDRYMHDTMFAPHGLDIGYNWSGVSQAARDRAAPGARSVDSHWSAEVDGAPPPSPHIAMYRGDAVALANYRPGRNGLAFAPHGGLRLSLADMDTLAGLFAHHKLADAQGLMTAPAWRYDPHRPNGATEDGFFLRYGLGVHRPIGVARDAYFGADTREWRGHFGDAYGWMTGLWWNARTRATIVYALNGMPETDRPRARTALTAPEQALIDLARAALGRS